MPITVTPAILNFLLSARRFWNDLGINLVFSSYKIKFFVIFKDPVPTALKSFVVYQFSLQDVTPVILVSPVAISQQGLKSTPKQFS